MRQVIAEISLTPTLRSPGAVWFATGFGRESRGIALTPTEAVWNALDHLIRGRRTGRGLVRIYSLGGDMMADASICAVPAYDRMDWRPTTTTRIEVGK
jgi:hypothetical protein